VNAEDVSIHLDFIEQATDWEHHVETWRLYQSGQFIHYAAFSDDWRDQSGLWPPDGTWKAGMWLGIGATIYRFTEVFEFAARFAQTAAGDETMAIRIDTVGIAARQFYVDNPSVLTQATTARRNWSRSRSNYRCHGRNSSPPPVSTHCVAVSSY
jgi:hypothetical protein